MSGPPITKSPLSSRFHRLSRDTSETIRTERPSLQPISIASLMQLETPHAVVDGSRMHQNIDKIAQYARDRRLNLRPHVKTHKDPEVAKLQLAAGAVGLTVATAKEAEAMATVCNDILVAYPPIDPPRIDRLLRLPPEVTLTIAADSSESLARLWQRAQHTGSTRRVRILVDLDLGGSRTGLSNIEEICALAHQVAQGPNTEFWGVMAYLGHVRRAVVEPSSAAAGDRADPDPSEEQFKEVSRDLKKIIEALRNSGLSCPIVSGGSTPTLLGSEFIPELTEVRPGTYAYSDRDMTAQGIFDWQDCAYSILSTVVSTAIPGQATIDAGSKSLAREPIPGLEGYGALLDCPEAIIRELHEEHGVLDLSRTDWRPKVGDRVRVVPNQVSVSVHLQDQVAFAEMGELTLRDVLARGR